MLWQQDKASVNAPSNQPRHLSYDNAAYAGSDIYTACHPPSLNEESFKEDIGDMGVRDSASMEPAGSPVSDTNGDFREEQAALKLSLRKTQ